MRLSSAETTSLTAHTVVAAAAAAVVHGRSGEAALPAGYASCAAVAEVAVAAGTGTGTVAVAVAGVGAAAVVVVVVVVVAGGALLGPVERTAVKAMSLAWRWRSCLPRHCPLHLSLLCSLCHPLLLKPWF